MTRFVQIGDLHLGRHLYGHRLLQDQRHALDQVLACVERNRPDALLVTGDVYDRSVPPSDAVELLDTFLHQVVKELGVQVVMIPGNHDSAERLGFGGRLFEGLHVAPGFTGQVEAIPVGDAMVYPVPYLDAARTRAVLEQPELRTRDQVTRAVLEGLEPCDGPRVVLAHTWVTGGSDSESERPLAIGGVQTVGADAFDDVDYVAVGHLHRPQEIGHIVYAGSLLPYSASEIGYGKSVAVVDLDADGLTVRREPIAPRHALRRIEGRIDDVLCLGGSEDYLIVRLMDEGPVHEAMRRLRTVFPNCLHIERPSLSIDGAVDAPDLRLRALEPHELFARFFREVTGQPLTSADRALLDSLVHSAQQAAK
ncbi:MAG: exonuclease SbcCD subunit D [Proteobacteria bacterium]|nr:exonuclease SbcCD subunit D [Pseudomonadota bacterium]MCP4916665.1 exonuclease SbcCD subunit D [Pseudomonadota bacterium]